MTVEELKKRLLELNDKVINFKPMPHPQDKRSDGLSWARRAKWYGGTSNLWKS